MSPWPRYYTVPSRASITRSKLPTFSPKERSQDLGNLLLVELDRETLSGDLSVASSPSSSVPIRCERLLIGSASSSFLVSRPFSDTWRRSRRSSGPCFRPLTRGWRRRWAPCSGNPHSAVRIAPSRWAIGERGKGRKKPRGVLAHRDIGSTEVYQSRSLSLWIGEDYGGNLFSYLKKLWRFLCYRF